MNRRGAWILAAIVALAVTATPLSLRAEETAVDTESTTIVSSEAVENAAEEAVKISLSRPVHFSGPDGSDVVAESGQYRVEASDGRLRLIPVGQGRPITIDAVTGTHESENEIALALALPGETEEEGDLFNIMLMEPGGISLEANGTYSGIKPRGFFDQAFKKAKQGVKQVVKQTNKAVADVKKGAEICLENKAACQKHGADVARERTKQHLEDAGNLAMRAKQEAERMARMQACRVAVSTIRAGKSIGGVMPPGLPGMKQVTDSMQRRMDQDSAFREQMRARMNQAIDNNRFMLPELNRLTAHVKNRANRVQMDALFTPDVFCSGSMAQFDNELRQLGLVPNFSMVQPRGVDDEHFYMGLQVTFDLALVGGGVIGLFGVTDFRGNGGFYWFYGWEAGIVVGAGGVAELAFFPKVNEASFSGKGWGVGATAGFVAVGAADVAFDENWKFQGFGLGGGAGAGSKMIGSAAVSQSWSQRL